METKKKIRVDEFENLTNIELDELFICEGVLYTIKQAETALTETNLPDSRNIFKFVLF
jgi:hypothetical protein